MTDRNIVEKAGRKQLLDSGRCFSEVEKIDDLVRALKGLNFLIEQRFSGIGIVEKLEITFSFESGSPKHSGVTVPSVHSAEVAGIYLLVCESLKKQRDFIKRELRKEAQALLSKLEVEL